MSAIYLIRHGQASFHSSNYDQLSDLGYQQAERVGQALRQMQVPFHAAYAGELKRQQQSAQQFLRHHPQVPLHTLPKLNEFHHENILEVFLGQFDDPDLFEREVLQNANPKQAFQQVFEKAILRWASGQHDAQYLESWSAFKARCLAALGQLVAEGQQLKQQQGQSVNLAVFTSAGVISAITKTLLNLPDREGFKLNWLLVNSGITKVVFGDNGPSIASLNEQTHLAEPGWLTFR